MSDGSGGPSRSGGPGSSIDVTGLGGRLGGHPVSGGLGSSRQRSSVVRKAAARAIEQLRATKDAWDSDDSLSE